MTISVFVGGPKDGERTETNGLLPGWLQFPDPGQLLTPKQAEDGIVPTCIYQLQREVGGWAIYAPRGVFFADVMAALIKGYKKID